MPRHSPLVRQWVLLRALCARQLGATIKELAEELEVCQKTVRRDLETFQSAGFPLAETAGQFGRKTWRLELLGSSPGMSFAYDEALALYLGRHLLQPLAGTVFGEAAGRAFKKIRASLGTGALRYVQRFAGMFHQTLPGAADYSEKAGLIDELLVAIEDRRAAFITYQSMRATEPVSYDVYPLGLVYHRGSLYLVGIAAQCGELRHWKVDRIEAVELTTVHFERPEDFDLGEHLSKSFGVFHGEGEVAVKIRFSPAVARYVREKTWHPSQRLSPQPDGSLLAEFCLGSTEEIKSWALGFGRHAEVLEPEELIEDISGQLTEMVQVYATRHRRVGQRALSSLKDP